MAAGCELVVPGWYFVEEIGLNAKQKWFHLNFEVASPTSSNLIGFSSPGFLTALQNLRALPTSVHLFGFRHRSARSALLLHAVEVMHRSDSFAQGLTFRDRSRNIRFGQQDGFRQSSIQRQMTRHGGCECAAGPMSGIRTLPL